jgi:sulfur-oxidizing protein SoxB
MTDCHAQLKPIYFREPSVNLGVGDMKGKLPHLVGERCSSWLRRAPGTPRRTPSPTSTSKRPRRRYGKVGGFAHLATLVKR